MKKLIARTILSIIAWWLILFISYEPAQIIGWPWAIGITWAIVGVFFGIGYLVFWAMWNSFE